MSNNTRSISAKIAIGAAVDLVAGLVASFAMNLPVAYAAVVQR